MPDDDVRSSGIGVIGGCEDMGVGVSGTKPGLLKEQQAFLTSEPPL